MHKSGIVRSFFYKVQNYLAIKGCGQIWAETYIAQDYGI